jgi:hypothetical protein
VQANPVRHGAVIIAPGAPVVVPTLTHSLSEHFVQYCCFTRKDPAMRTARSFRILAWLACVGVWLGAVYASESSPAPMAAAASKFLASLPPEQKAQATFPFGSGEREHWGFVPTEIFPRKGLTIGAMSEPQRKLAHDLLKTGLSQKGYLTATSIMQLEDVLRVIEDAGGGDAAAGRRMERNPVKYFVSVFGTPGAHGAWGWRVEGHHVSLNFTIVDGKLVTATPQFFGSNPAEVRDGPKKGLRILADEEDSARTLLMALNPTQRAKAVINTTAPGDIVTGNKLTIDPLSPAGISAADLEASQRDLLMKVIDAYASAMAPDIVADRMTKLRQAGIERIGFAWAGEAERGKKHYYRVQGPTFLIEYDNTQNDANHIHSVWRDFNGDFGRDVLREHMKSVAH